MLSLNKYKLAYRLLIGYIYVMLFAGVVFKYIGIPNELGFILLAAFDVLPLIMWALSNPSFRINTKEIFVDTLRFWVLCICIFALLLLSNVRHNGSIGGCLTHYGALVRYIPLACSVVSINKSININDAIIKHLKIVTIVLLLIGYICIALGEKAEILLPILPETATGLRETQNGSYAGIFANTVDFAFVLLILYTIFVYRARSRILLLTILFFFPVFKTGSATATVAFVIIVFFKLTQNNHIIRWIFMFIIVLILGFLVIQYWWVVDEIIENTKLSRLGMLTLTGPDFISEFSLDTFWGVGCDGYVVLDKVNSYQDTVLMLAASEDGDISALGDVYWIALLVYHGIVGLMLIIYIYYNLFKATINKRYSDSKFDYSRIVKWLFFLIVFISFANQIIVVKTFAVFFWIFLAIVYNKKVTTQTNENTTNQQLQLS